MKTISRVFGGLALAVAIATSFVTGQAPEPVQCCGQAKQESVKVVLTGPATQVQQILAMLPANDVRAEPIQAKAKHPRGRKAMSAEMRAHFHRKAAARNDNHVAKLPKCTTASFDANIFGALLPTDDQGQCGDCYGVSAFDVCSDALIKAGKLPNDSTKGRLASQYGLDNSQVFQGGCGGGDEAQVIDFVMTTGAPLTSDYGPYTASPGRQKQVGTVYKIANYGYCTPSQEQGVASTQDMKNCIAQYGSISVALDASEFDNYTGGTITGNGTNVDHAIKCEGWDDNHDNGDGSKGAWIVRNQWGQADANTVSFQSQPWGITINGVTGRAWMKYGADSIGTEAIWVSGGTPPPVPPGPVPPPPVPPTPPVAPVPPTPPTPGTISITLTNDQAVAVATQLGWTPPPAAGTVRITLSSAAATELQNALSGTTPPAAVAAPVYYDYGADACANGSCGTMQGQRGGFRLFRRFR
ncbi:MAG: hypothetical protein KGL39_25675 [Patescibacteria group bacterium]|nr:hypothetical protein [Patescibacteria group bacterium]